MSYDRKLVRAAVKHWRERHPDVRVRVIHHGWYGHVLWNTDGEAGPVATMRDVIAAYKTQEDFSKSFGQPTEEERIAWGCYAEDIHSETGRCGAPVAAKITFKDNPDMPLYRCTKHTWHGPDVDVVPIRAPQ